MKHLHGQRIYVDFGRRPGGRASIRSSIAVMDEIGIDVTKHRPKIFDQLEDDYFDLVITLSPEAHHKALEMTRTMACDVEYWPTFDPTAVEGNRDDQARRLSRGARHAAAPHHRTLLAGAGRGCVRCIFSSTGQRRSMRWLALTSANGPAGMVEPGIRPSPI